MSAERCTAGRAQGSGFRVQFFAPSRDQTWSRFGRADAVSRLVTPYSVLSTQYRGFGVSRRALFSLLLLLLPAAVATAVESFADKISALAAECDELGPKGQAALTRAWNIQRY